MRIAGFFSHLNGHEFIAIHKPALWDEIAEALGAVRKERTSNSISNRVANSLSARGWTRDPGQPWFPRFTKERLALTLAMVDGNGDNIPIAGHTLDYARNAIDVGIIVRPMSGLIDDLGLSCISFEQGREALVEEGRTAYHTPIVLIGAM